MVVCIFLGICQSHQIVGLFIKFFIEFLFQLYSLMKIVMYVRSVEMSFLLLQMFVICGSSFLTYQFARAFSTSFMFRTSFWFIVLPTLFCFVFHWFLLFSFFKKKNDLLFAYFGLNLYFIQFLNVEVQIIDLRYFFSSK